MPIAKLDRIIIDRDFKPVTVEDVFLKYRAELIKDLRQSLIKANRDQPGKLLQSIDATINVTVNNVSFSIEMEDYWKFVDKGVDGTEQSQGSEYKYKKNGKRIPLDAMKKFVAARGLTPKPKSKKVRKTLKNVSNTKNLDSLAWAIGVNIKKKGLEPTHFFTDIINESLKKRMTADISIALKRDIELQFLT
jgi:hypothetical protein